MIAGSGGLSCFADNSTVDHVTCVRKSRATLFLDEDEVYHIVPAQKGRPTLCQNVRAPLARCLSRPSKPTVTHRNIRLISNQCESTLYSQPPDEIESSGRKKLRPT